MKELNKNEIKNVNGGLGPLVIPVAKAVVSVIGGVSGAAALGYVLGKKLRD
ncbi:hypothetical protein CS022_18260 [Veronia nyctiphanis]|uniref:Class IIb bacteriocin, lactobin A/cerein 7B family n=1 Tax=Veronia nyctiphanis TaxID=1278244 RepID=A0A4Q0YNJ0_9GAMM|nr:class IIb bacteriocin, lactobin A/cerein 7B family [Veronia nyctiphanis]RXJ72023.1 hypothetical protein CS022_17980 [Veronia nyctiphanis]RXJ72070.1 hypothetical protein CS022_18260 [Veronia nyctiphanis]